MDFPIKNGGFPIKNGGFPIKNGGFPIKNGGFPIKTTMKSPTDQPPLPRRSFDSSELLPQALQALQILRSGPRNAAQTEEPKRDVKTAGRAIGKCQEFTTRIEV